MAKRVRSNARTKNGIRIADVKLEDGRKVLEYDYTIRVGGELVRRRRTSEFPSRRQTQAFAEAERAALIASGGKLSAEPPRASPGEPRTMRFWAGRWLEDAENPARQRGRNRASTILRKESVVRNHIAPKLGHRLVTHVDEDVVEGFVRGQLEEGTAETSLRLQLSYVRSILLYAKRKGTGAEREIQTPDNLKLRKPKRKKDEVTLSEAQTRKALAAARIRSQHLYALACFLFRQGMRIGEAMALRWSAVDLDAGAIDIIQSWDRHSGFGDTKGGEPRRVPLHPETAAVLQALKGDGNGNPWRLVFANPRDEQRPWYHLIKKLVSAIDGLELRDELGKTIHFTTHVGRHSFGRHWAERGLPFRALQDILGHTSITVTEIYMRWAPSENAQHIARIGSDKPADIDAITATLSKLGVDDSLLIKAGLKPRTKRHAKRGPKKRRRA